MQTSCACVGMCSNQGCAAIKDAQNGKMEEDVKPEDEDGVDGRGTAFGLVRGARAFAAVLPSFALVSRMPFAQHNHGFGHSFSATSSS